jgi:hypothetical protein
MYSQLVIKPNNRKMRRVFVFMILFFLINISINSQEKQIEVNSIVIPKISGEQIRLYTDQNIYCVNEKIEFAAEYSCLKELDSISWSNVLYIELIKWNGNKQFQMVMKLTKPLTSGSMKIPANILSGNYYLRAYTKWMRNFSAGNYAYLPVKIVNPYKSEIDEGNSDASAKDGTVELKMHSKKIIDAVSCSLIKNEFKPREMAKVDLQLNDSVLFDFDRFCISVTKKHSIDTSCQFYEPNSNSNSNNSGLSYIEYLPEIIGITISGIIIDKSTKLPQKNVLLSLSEPKYGEYYSVYQTNDSGRFVFSLPDIMGQRELFFQADEKSSDSPEILIDNGFCNKPVKLPYIAFILNDEERSFIKEKIVDMQLCEKYQLNKDTLLNSQNSDKDPLPFYGSKKQIYYTEKYIELPNIEEFISEIILEATIIKGKKENSHISMKRTNLSSFSPLILMDNVKVNNDDLLLKIPLDKIERVEVINKDYIVAGMNYSGIISIYSKNKDFAGLELNKKSIFFNYELFSENNPGFDYNKTSTNSRIPDRRELLYWNPDFHLSVGQKATFSFYTSDSKGDFEVYIIGKNNNDNRQIYGKCYFSVK